MNLLGILPLLLAFPVLAHDLWIERAGAVHTLAYGHERSAHEGAKSLEYRPEHVKEALCFDPAGKPLQAETVRAYPVQLKGDCAAAWFQYSSGYWSKTPYGAKNLPRNEAGPVLDSWWSTEGAKLIHLWGSGLDQPLTRHLELVPLANPLRLKAGDKLRLRAWFQGKPAAGVTVAYFGKPRGVTDAEGLINIRLQQGGLQLLQASLEQPLNDARAERAVHAGHLQFELP